MFTRSSEPNICSAGDHSERGKGQCWFFLDKKCTLCKPAKNNQKDIIAQKICKAHTKFSVTLWFKTHDTCFLVKSAWKRHEWKLHKYSSGVSVFIYDVVRTLPAVLPPTIQITLWYNLTMRITLVLVGTTENTTGNHSSVKSPGESRPICIVPRLLLWRVNCLLLYVTVSHKYLYMLFAAILLAQQLLTRTGDDKNL